MEKGAIKINDPYQKVLGKMQLEKRKGMAGLEILNTIESSGLQQVFIGLIEKEGNTSL